VDSEKNGISLSTRQDCQNQYNLYRLCIERKSTWDPFN